MPRMLYYGDVSCVCKRWYAVMKSLTMVNFLRTQRWPSYAALELHPRRDAIASIHARTNVMITTGDDGEVYNLFQASVYQWRVLRGSELVWEIEGRLIDMRSVDICPTFAVVGTMMYIRCEAGIKIFRDGTPFDIIPFAYGVRKIILSQGKVYILHHNGIHTVEGVLSKQFTFLNWRDIAVDRDVLYGATPHGLQKWDKGKITSLCCPTGSIDIYDQNLYCCDKRSGVYVLIAGEIEQVVRYDAGFKAYAVVGEIIFIAIEHGILGFSRKGGEPFRISCPHVQKIWGAAGKLYAVDCTGNVLKYI